MARKKEETVDNKTVEKVFTLSDKTKVVMRKGNGLDVIKARKACDNDEDKLQIYLVAQLSTFDGKRRPAEELVELPIDDFLLLETMVRGLVATKNFLAQGI